MKTKFINCSEEAKETKKETVFTHLMHEYKGWVVAKDKPKKYDEVIYMGNCVSDGDIFIVKYNGMIMTFKGIKGDEFD